MTKEKLDYVNKTYKNIGDGKNWIKNTFQIDDHIVFNEDEGNYTKNICSIVYYFDMSFDGNGKHNILYCNTYGKCIKWLLEFKKYMPVKTFDEQFVNLSDGDLFQLVYKHDLSEVVKDYYIKTDLGGALHLESGQYESFEGNNNMYKLKKISDDKKIKMIESIKEL